MPNEKKKIIKVKTKVNFHDSDVFDEVKTEASEPSKHSVTELTPQDFDYKDREDALNEEFDQTYVGKKSSVPVYKKWWFWLMIAALLVALAFLLFNHGKIDNSPETTSSTTTTSVTSTTTDVYYQTIEARNVSMPGGTEVRKGADGKWALFDGNQIMTNYNGVASNDNGTWYINNGYVDFNYTGYLKVNGTTYMVNKGRVDISRPVETVPQTVAGADPTTTEAQTVTQDAGINSAGTQSQQDALAVAVDYINQMAFSKQWLIAQVEADGYNHEDATWAADHCGANWNEQAYKKAQEYLKLTSFTKDDMITQLQFEGFTDEQAAYGAEKAGL